MAGYNYQEQRKYIFTESGVKDILKAKEFADKAISVSGCVNADKIMSSLLGSTWDNLAVIDYLCEIGKLTEVKKEYTSAQDRIFIK